LSLHDEKNVWKNEIIKRVLWTNHNQNLSECINHPLKNGQK
jgi:hypothetical protein